MVFCPPFGGAGPSGSRPPSVICGKRPKRSAREPIPEPGTPSSARKSQKLISSPATYLRGFGRTPRPTVNSVRISASNSSGVILGIRRQWVEGRKARDTGHGRGSVLGIKLSPDRKDSEPVGGGKRRPAPYERIVHHPLANRQHPAHELTHERLRLEGWVRRQLSLPLVRRRRTDHVPERLGARHAAQPRPLPSAAGSPRPSSPKAACGRCPTAPTPTAPSR